MASVLTAFCAYWPCEEVRDAVGRVASGPAAVAYFTGGTDARAAGCGVGYYTRDDTTGGAGRWVGSGAAALGMSGGLAEATRRSEIA